MKKLVIFINVVMMIGIFACKNSGNQFEGENNIMKIAAICDIHGNSTALEAVLEEIANEDVDLIIVGGDVVSGPMPKETLALLQNVKTSTRYILGNAESEVIRYLNGEEVNGLSERANEEAQWVSTLLSAENVELIKGWSTIEKIQSKELGTLLFCHGTPQSNVEIFTKVTPDEKLELLFENVDASVVVCGHSHMQFDRNIENIRIVNAGSVGMPFGKTGADWLLIDSSIHFKHTDYNIEKAAKRILKSNYPHAESFVENNVLKAPSESDAIKMLTKLEQSQNIKE